MRLYEGSSANKAEDMTQIVNGGLSEGAEASVRRETVDGKRREFLIRYGGEGV